MEDTIWTDKICTNVWINNARSSSSSKKASVDKGVTSSKCTTRYIAQVKIQFQAFSLFFKNSGSAKSVPHISNTLASVILSIGKGAGTTSNLFTRCCLQMVQVAIIDLMDLLPPRIQYFSLKVQQHLYSSMAAFDMDTHN